MSTKPATVRVRIRAAQVVYYDQTVEMGREDWEAAREWISADDREQLSILLDDYLDKRDVDEWEPLLDVDSVEVTT